MKATFEALSQNVYAYTVLMPDGTEMDIEMRGLTSAEVLEVEETNPMPKPPKSKTTPFHKIGEQVYEVYDPQDAGYLAERARVQRTRYLHFVARSWVADIPGETPDEKVAALEGLPTASINALIRCLNETLTAGQVHARPFRDVGESEE